jgi:endonuclease YncB( thermonuclease family)
MKKIIFKASLILLLSSSCYGKPIKIDRVIDGDTFEILKPTPPADVVQTKHRLIGIDTPETFKQVAKCQKEIDLGNKAKQFVSNFVKDGKFDIEYIELDKYGRYLVHIYKGDINLGDELVKNGLAVYYDGGTKTKDWCK